MTEVQSIVPYLPFLRRFARLLTGSQRTGDVLVLATLQKLAADPKELAGGIDSKIGLYRALLRIWKSPVGDHIIDVARRESPEAPMVQRERFQHMLGQAVFLLTHSEEFPPAAVMAVVELSEREFEDALAYANTQVSRLLATDVMIIEDELLIAHELETIMTSIGHSVSSIVRIASQAVKVARKRPPKLILSDIQLADGSSGIDAVSEITKTNPVPAIFITAYPERLLTGLRKEPTYLVSKPFRTEQIKAIVAQAVFFDTQHRMKITGPQLTATLAQEWNFV